MTFSRLLACRALLCLGIIITAQARSLPSSTSQVQPQEVLNSLFGSSQQLTAGTQLLLCECEPAEGPPNGLGCAKEGWFISSFEKQGEWMGGGGLVPLSRAICCRPCMPGSIPDHSRIMDSTSHDTAVQRIELHAQLSTTITSTPPPHGVEQGFETASNHQLGSKAQQEAAGEIPQLPTALSTAVASLASSRHLLPADSKERPHSSSSVYSLHSAAPVHGSQPLGFVSVGCHPPSGSSFSPLACEPNGNSFVTGFSHAQRVSAIYPDIWYPYGQVECCTPALLLASGDLWPLERCNCGQSWTKECGGLETHKLLSGFADWRVSGTGDLIPVAPLQCCQLCLAAAPIPTPGLSCHDLANCNGNGVCVLGACQCFEGYGGADCSVPARSGADMIMDMPWWAMCLTLFGAVLVLYGIIVAGRTTYDAVQSSQQARQAGARGEDHPGGPGTSTIDQLALPLLLQYLDEEGSAGSHDTDAEDAAHEAAEAEPDEPVSPSRARAERAAQPASPTGGRAVHAAQHGRTAQELEGGVAGEGAVVTLEREVGGEQVDSQAVSTPRSVMNGHIEGQGAEQHTESVGGVRNAHDSEQPTPSQGSPQTTSAEHAHGEEGHGEETDNNGEGLEHGDEDGTCVSPSHHVAGVGRNGAVGSVCVVCMEAPVQVALVPCGHAVSCRKCSRRLTHCPLCRKLIGRRQRLYFSFGNE